MTEERSPDPDSLAGDAEEDRLRSLIRGALKEESRPVDVLGGVQKKLRERSGGKFYADFWSTAKAPPTATLLATGVIMLAVIAVAYAILFPLSGRPERVPMDPVPIDVVAPAPGSAR